MIDEGLHGETISVEAVTFKDDGYLGLLSTAMSHVRAFHPTAQISRDEEHCEGEEAWFLAEAFTEIQAIDETINGTFVFQRHRG